MDSTKLKQDEFEKIQNAFVKIKKIDNCIGGICEKYWIICNDKKYLFKFPDNNDFSDFGEVFTSYLSFLLGFKCVKSRFCDTSIFEYENLDLSFSDDTPTVFRTGALIEDFRDNSVIETVSFHHLKGKYIESDKKLVYTTSLIYNVVEKYCSDYNILIDKNLLQELKEMALIDFLLLQTDRHSNNIEFLICEENGIKTLKLAPMFDNGFCMHLYNEPNNIHLNYINYKKQLKENVVISLKGENAIINPSPLFFISDNFAEGKTSIEHDLVKELSINPKLKKLYNGFKELNIKNEIEFLRKMYKREMPNILIETMVMAVENRVNLIEKEMQKYKNINEKELAF